jgi:hypothetical protein
VLFAAAGLAVLVVPGRALAGEVSVEVRLGQPRARVGEGVFVQVTVEGRGGVSIGEPSFPVLAGVQVVERGSSFQQMTFGIGAGGGSTVTRTYDYLLVADRPGRFELEITVVADGHTVRPARAPVLEVTGEAADAAEAATPQARPGSADEEVFLWPTVDREEAWVGQALRYRLELWERTDADVQMRTIPTFEDFWVEELEADRRRRDMVDGVPYRVHPLLERALFPQKAGELVVGAGEVVVTPQSGLGLFRPGRRRPPHAVHGPALRIRVLPLPAEGQPPGFPANNVGRFDLRSEVDRIALRQGDALTFTVTVRGTGNVRFVEPPPLPEMPGLRVYDPQEQLQVGFQNGEVAGERRWKYLVVAQAAGPVTIPALELDFFDPEPGGYRVARSEPIRIEVEPDGTTTSAVPALESGAEPDEGELLADLVAPESLPRTEPRPPLLTPDRWAGAALAAPAAFGLGLLLLRVRDRVYGDPRMRARVARVAHRRRLVDDARRATARGDGFFPALGELLQTAAVERAPAGAGLPRERLAELLGREGVPEADLDRWRRLIDACDAARFGSEPSDEATRRQALADAVALVEGPSFRPRGST